MASFSQEYIYHTAIRLADGVLAIWHKEGRNPSPLPEALKRVIRDDPAFGGLEGFDTQFYRRLHPDQRDYFQTVFNERLKAAFVNPKALEEAAKGLVQAGVAGGLYVNPAHLFTPQTFAEMSEEAKQKKDDKRSR